MERLIAGVRQHSSPVDVFAAFEGQAVEVACPGRVASRCEELQAEQPAAVHGLGGIGKSTLARDA
jgi:hypothetical protein